MADRRSEQPRNAVVAYDEYTSTIGGQRFVMRRRRPLPGPSVFYHPSQIPRGGQRFVFSPAAAAAVAAAEIALSAAAGDNKRARLAEATEAAIQGLPEVRPTKLLRQAADQCSVCLMDFDADDKLRAMPCAHTFHEECIFKWLRRKAACPLCRHELPTQHNHQNVLKMPAPEDP